MIITYNQILHLPIFAIRDQANLGRVSEIIIDNNKLSIAALVVSSSWLAKSIKVVPSTDMIELLKEAILVSNETAKIDVEEIPRIKKYIKSRLYGLGQKVFTEKGRYLGRVNDFMVESTSLEIKNFYVKHLFFERIISSSSVIEFTGRKIVIKDELKSILVSETANALD